MLEMPLLLSLPSPPLDSTTLVVDHLHLPALPVDIMRNGLLLFPSAPPPKE